MRDSPPDATIAERYVVAVESFVGFARSLTADEWAMPSPCTPGWTARDVLSHVAGIPDDGLAGRTEGAATPPWTASQVERNRDHSVDFLLDRWLDQYELFAAVIDEMGEERPPIDCHTHEHDVRCAIDRPGHRDSSIVASAAPRAVALLADVPIAFTVVLDDGTKLESGGAGPTVAVSGLTSFEMFRSRLGRRSRAQVEAYDWAGEPDAIGTAIDAWFIFGPSSTDIDEG